MNGLCLIVSGGEFAPLPEDLRRPAFVIACDRGWQYARRLGLLPDLTVGDFDSAPPPETGAPVERVPTRKDDTDTMLAARRALEKGFRDIAVCCAFGGRLDHTLANVQALVYALDRHARIALADGKIWMTALRGGESLPLGRKYGKALRASLEAWQKGEPE